MSKTESTFHKIYVIFLEKNFLTLNFFRNVKILRLEFEWMLKKMSNFYLLQAGLQVNHQDHQNLSFLLKNSILLFFTYQTIFPTAFKHLATTLENLITDFLFKFWI
jgi:hypothetical protein